MTLFIIVGIIVLALLGVPLYAIIGLAGLVAYHYADLDSAGSSLSCTGWPVLRL